MSYYQGDPISFGLARVGLGLGKRLLGKALQRGGIIKKGAKIAAGGAIFETGARVTRRFLGGGGGDGERCPQGYHPCKRPGTCREDCVRNRQMNVANPRALRRSIRRGKGFLKMSKQFIGLYQGKIPKGRRFLKKR